MFKKIALTAFAILGVAGIASADPIVLPANQPLVMDFENVEQININPNPATCITVPDGYGCSDNWGFIRIRTIDISSVGTPHEFINDGGNTSLFNGNDATQTAEIYGIFYGLQITGCTGGSTPGTGSCTAQGGFLDLYWHNDGIVPGVNAEEAQVLLLPNAASVNAVDTVDADTFFLARLMFDTGVIDNNPTTVTSDINLSLGQGSGNGNGYLNVVPGATVGGNLGVWADVLNGNWFNTEQNGDGIRGSVASELRDMRFRNTFNRFNAWDSTPACQFTVLPGPPPSVVFADPNAPCAQGLNSSDPATVFSALQVSEVPEPATLALLGTGLAALGARRRRKA